MANSISPMLEFEEDVPSNHPDGRLPILDLKVWVMQNEGGCLQMRHEFYKKPMASRATLRATTAYPNSQLRAIMVEEVLRRLRNCSPEATWEERGKHLSEFAMSLKCSGHQEHFRTVVFTKAVAQFEKELEAHKAGRADLYRSREERARQLQERGGKSTKDSWFRKTGAGGTRTTSVLKVPYTPGGTLKQQMAKVLESKQAPDGISTRVQEGGGDKLQHALMRPDPFPRSECHRRQTCPITRGEKGCKDNCYQGHVNYTIECTRCWESHCQRRRQHDGDAGGGQLTPRYVYYGETSRGCHVRFSQHITGYRAHSNFMWQHTQDVHDGVVGAEPREDYFMVREALDADPTRRILRESVRISWLRNRSSSDLAGKIVLMNGKDEWFGVKVVQPSFVQE